MQLRKRYGWFWLTVIGWMHSLWAWWGTAWGVGAHGKAKLFLSWMGIRGKERTASLLFPSRPRPQWPKDLPYIPSIEGSSTTHWCHRLLTKLSTWAFVEHLITAVPESRVAQLSFWWKQWDCVRCGAVSWSDSVMCGHHCWKQLCGLPLVTGTICPKESQPLGSLTRLFSYWSLTRLFSYCCNKVLEAG